MHALAWFLLGILAGVILGVHFSASVVALLEKGIAAVTSLERTVESRMTALEAAIKGKA
jgi:hypothetical protein